MKAILGENYFELEQEFVLLSDEIANPKNIGQWHLEKGQILNQMPNYLTDSIECRVVLASTFPLDGVPLIVIDEAEILYPYTDDMTNIEECFVGRNRDGYNKTKKTFKYTEEDLINYSNWYVKNTGRFTYDEMANKEGKYLEIYFSQLKSKEIEFETIKAELPCSDDIEDCEVYHYQEDLKIVPHTSHSDGMLVIKK